MKLEDGVLEIPHVGVEARGREAIAGTFAPVWKQIAEAGQQRRHVITGIRIESDEAGVYIALSADRPHIFVTGHSEYDPLTLRSEYARDVNKGLPIAVPKNYFPNDDPKREPVVRWRGHASLLYANWLNYYVYQETPFRLEDIH